MIVEAVNLINKKDYNRIKNNGLKGTFYKCIEMNEKVIKISIQESFKNKIEQYNKTISKFINILKTNFNVENNFSNRIEINYDSNEDNLVINLKLIETVIDNGEEIDKYILEMQKSITVYEQFKRHYKLFKDWSLIVLRKRIHFELECLLCDITEENGLIVSNMLDKFRD